MSATVLGEDNPITAPVTLSPGDVVEHDCLIEFHADLSGSLRRATENKEGNDRETRDRADAHVAEIDVPAVLAFWISTAGEGGHGPLKRNREAASRLNLGSMLARHQAQKISGFLNEPTSIGDYPI